MFTGSPVIYGIHPHEDSTEQKHPVGTIGITNDGRTYRYCQAGGTALEPGTMCIAPDITTNHEDLAVNTFAVNDKEMSITLGATAITGNEYQEGFVNVTDASGQGIMYKIKSCPATAQSTAVTVYLEEPVKVVAEADTTVTLYRNKYRDVLVSDGTQDDLPVGVPNVEIAANAYGWLQTGGPCSILVDANDSTVGKPITIGDGTAGGVESRNAATETYVGNQPAGVGADPGEYGVFELTLD